MNIPIIEFIAIFSLYLSVLWNGCDTTICGRRQLNIQCDVSSYILINNVTSEQGQAFDKRSYLNLRRMCLGRETFDPSRSGFCRTHSNVEFRVSYVCVRGKCRILHYKRSFAIQEHTTCALTWLFTLKAFPVCIVDLT